MRNELLRERLHGIVAVIVDFLNDLLDVAKVVLAKEDRERAIVELVKRVRRPDVLLDRLGEFYGA